MKRLMAFVVGPHREAESGDGTCLQHEGVLMFDRS